MLLNDGRKVWTTVLFLSAIMHMKVIRVNGFIFSAIFGRLWLVEIQKFFDHGNVIRLLLSFTSLINRHYDEFSSSVAAAGLSKVLILRKNSNVQTKITSHNCLF